MLKSLGAFLAELLETTPPSLDGPALGELWDLLKTGRRFRALGRTDSFRLLRWMPMAAADLVAEWFTNDLVQAAVAARGIFGVGAGSLVRRHGRDAAPERGSRSRAGRQQRDRQGRTGRADARHG